MDGHITFDAYYSWLADLIGLTFADVPFTFRELAASRDPSFNDLRLDVWVRREYAVVEKARAAGCAGALSVSDAVCLLKTVARRELDRWPLASVVVVL